MNGVKHLGELFFFFKIKHLTCFTLKSIFLGDTRSGKIERLFHGEMQVKPAATAIVHNTCTKGPTSKQKPNRE